MQDLAWAFPRFSIAAIGAFVRSQDPKLPPAERAVYFELSQYLERASETPVEDLPALYEELCSTDEMPGNLARSTAADIIDRVLDEREGRVHVPN